MQVQVKEWTELFPKQLNKIVGLIKEKFSISVSKKTIKRVLKKFNFTWRRIKKKVAGKACSRL